MERTKGSENGTHNNYDDVNVKWSEKRTKEFINSTEDMELDRHIIFPADNHQTRENNNNKMEYANSLSSAQMETVTALCDTFLPSVDVSTLAADDPLFTFYATSASMAGTPERLGGLVSSRLEHPKKWLMKLALWALSTWYGTFILCGFYSVSATFPYFRSFPNLPQHRREQILRNWSQSYIFLLRILYRAAKLLTLLVYFTQVDEKDHNHSWKAIGYCGPDPDFKPQIEQQQTNHDEEEEEEEKLEEIYGPLYRGIVDLNNPKDHLTRLGFPSKYNNRHRFQSCSTSISDPFVTIQCDVVVVGSGSGGGLVAGVLASSGYKVVVLEKGDYYARKSLTLLEGSAMDQMYLSGGLVATDDMEVFILAGSTVGGGSTVNWSASIRTPGHVAAEWCDRCELELFGSEMYKEALDEVCKRMEVQEGFLEEGFNNAVLRSGCEELGYPVKDIPRNAPADHYCGWCCLGCKDGSKKGASETWLVDLVKSGSGVILAGCEAVKVLHHRKPGRDRNTAKGVAFEFRNANGGREMGIVEAKVTVVACGALRTPTLLKASGLKNPNIGKNLHIHPVVMVWGYFPESSDEPVFKEKKSFEGGIMTAMSTVAAEFEKSGYGVVIQTPSLHPGMFSVLMPWVSGKDIKDRMRRFSRTAHVFVLARDKGCGTVDSPSSISYRMDDGDEEKLKAGVEKVLRIMAAAGAEEIGTHQREGKTLNVKSVPYREFERFVKEEGKKGIRGHSTPICSAHQMGSCRMGVDPRTSAVGPTGETWEVEGLFVADTSVFPTALGVNPMVTVQAISYCTAQSIIQVLKRKKKITL